MNADKIRENIERGVYDADYARLKGRKVIVPAVMQKAFRDDLEAVFGTKDWVSKNEIWNKAWEDGHYAGFNEVLNYYEELVGMFKEVEMHASDFKKHLTQTTKDRMPEHRLKTKPVITYNGKQIAPSPAYIRPSSVAGAPQDWLLYLGAYYSYYINDLLIIRESSLELEKEGLRGKVGGEDRPPCGTIPQRVCLNAGRGDNDQTWCENAREIIIEAMRVIFSGSYTK